MLEYAEHGWNAEKNVPLTHVFFCFAARVRPCIMIGYGEVLLAGYRRKPAGTLWAVSTRRGWNRADWEGLDASARSHKWTQLLRTTGIRCSLAIDHRIWYPTEQAYIRGVRATRDIEPGDEVCRVPAHMLMSELTVANSTLRPLLEFAIDELKVRPMAVLACFVLREGSRRASRWMPFIQSAGLLEAGYDLPAAAGPSSPRFLAMSPFEQRLVLKKREVVLEEYEALRTRAFPRFTAALAEGLGDGFPWPCDVGCAVARLARGTYSRERFVAVYAAMAARSWELAFPADARVRTLMVPHFDLANHGQQGLRTEIQAAHDPRRHEFAFKGARSFEERAAEVGHIMGKHPDIVPVICEKDPRSELPPPTDGKNKFLVPRKLSVAQLAGADVVSEWQEPVELRPKDVGAAGVRRDRD